ANYDFAIARLKNELASDILELRPTLSLSVSPNPARNILYVTVPQSVAKALRLQVTGMDGKIWINREEKADAEGKIKLNVKDLPEGFYALRVVAGLDWGVISFVVH
ncbi:MAG TPA: T9SS type A sorting domain-containing protein, partial [Saprospiraceae bacterium]|nr:T9SS type A sorting domain-containing protein [Saprospiraceae bacterium]